MTSDNCVLELIVPGMFTVDEELPILIVPFVLVYKSAAIVPLAAFMVFVVILASCTLAFNVPGMFTVDEELPMLIVPVDPVCPNWIDLVLFAYKLTSLASVIELILLVMTSDNCVLELIVPGMFTVDEELPILIVPFVLVYNKTSLVPLVAFMVSVTIPEDTFNDPDTYVIFAEISKFPVDPVLPGIPVNPINPV